MLLTPLTLRATVLTDASYCPYLKVGGWAAWVRIDNRAEAVKQQGMLLWDILDDSGMAEAMAAANGIWLAANLGAKAILLQTDCMAVVHLINGQSMKSERLLTVWAKLWALPIMRGVEVTARHVKGHGPVVNARTYVNGWCDRAAREEMEKARAIRRPANYQEDRTKSGGGRKGKRKVTHSPRRLSSWT